MSGVISEKGKTGFPSRNFRSEVRPHSRTEFEPMDEWDGNSRKKSFFDFGSITAQGSASSGFRPERSRCSDRWIDVSRKEKKT